MSASPPSRSATSGIVSLVARDLSKAYAECLVLDGVDVTASPGVLLGLVGENGAGKTTLLRLLAGVESPDNGEVVRPSDLVFLPQEPDFGGTASVGEVLDEALAPLHEAAGRLETLAAHLGDRHRTDVAAEYAAVLDWCVVHDVWDADRRTEVAAARLGLGTVDRGQPVSALSGGERSRLALAALVARRPTCVLLDEPTNHLDDTAVELLEEFLRDLPGVVVAASHDRMFLQQVCHQVLDLDRSHFGTDGRGGARFSGSYTDYLTAKRLARQRWEEAFVAQQDEMRSLRATAATTARQVAHNRAPRDNDRFIYFAKGQKVARTVSRRVRDTERRLDALEREQIPKPVKPLTFDQAMGFPSTGGGRVVLVRNLEVAGRLRLPDLDADAGDRILVTGGNGSGKSTLLKVLAGRLAPTSGTAQVSARDVGHLPQDVTFARPERSAQQVYDGVTGSPVPLGELELLHPRDLWRPVGVLSVGQQRRLALAVLVARGADLLLLDEPTNHISLTLAEELEAAVGRSRGTVLVASHDRWLRCRWQQRVVDLARKA